MFPAVSGVHWLAIEPSMGDQLGESERARVSPEKHTPPPTNKGTKGSPILRLGQR